MTDERNEVREFLQDLRPTLSLESLEKLEKVFILINSDEKHITELEKEKCELLGIIQGKDKAIKELQNGNFVLTVNEIIEGKDKKIADLEKENADLKEEINKIAFARGNLEEENAELKEYNKYLKRKRQGGIQKQYNKLAIIKQRDDQLTKAKEILKEFVHHYKAKTIYVENMQDLLEEAEQFLNSEVEK